MQIFQFIFERLNLQVKEDEMGRACSTNGERGMHIGYWWESQEERDH
jgi:hypothetical protein